MDKLQNLRDLVCELEKKHDEGEQIKKLQEIGAKLIGEYEIRVKDLTIKPLWVEAYYYSQSHFPDCNTHMSAKQKGSEHYGHMYFHETGRGGFDICLSNGDYYLSFLLKATLINQKFCTQTGIYDFIDKSSIPKIEKEANILHKVAQEKKQRKFIYAKRINLAKPCYIDAPLAVTSMDILGIPEYDFTFAHKSLSGLAESYMKDYIVSNPNKTKKEYKDECTKTFGWCPDVVDSLLKGVQ